MSACHASIFVLCVVGMSEAHKEQWSYAFMSALFSQWAGFFTLERLYKWLSGGKSFF